MCITVSMYVYTLIVVSYVCEVVYNMIPLCGIKKLDWTF